MLQIVYQCSSCGKKAPDDYGSMICTCGGYIVGRGFNIMGTQDSFGISKNFIHTNDDGTKKEIKSWKQWEKAGYKDALQCTKNHNVREMIKEKQEKLKRTGVKSAL